MTTKPESVLVRTKPVVQGVCRPSRIVQDDGDAQQAVGSELIQDSQQMTRAVRMLENRMCVTDGCELRCRFHLFRGGDVPLHLAGSASLCRSKEVL